MGPLASEATDPELVDECVALVRRWLDVASGIPADSSAARLADLLADPDGLTFAVSFIDGVIRPEDPRVAARNLDRLARSTPAFLPLYLRLAVRFGGVVGRVLPAMVAATARRALRRMVSHLVIDAADRTLTRSIGRLQRRGLRLNLNLLGEAVLGKAEASRRLAQTRRILMRDDVDYVSLKVSSVVGPHSPWAFEETAAHIVDTLAPLFEEANASSSQKFINLDMEEYRDLDLTVAVFTALLDRPALLSLEAGIVLQAYLPDSLPAMVRLQDWAADRRRRGGAAIKVRVVKGANLPMERVDAEIHGWPLATWASKRESDTNYKRLLDFAMTTDRMDNVRLGIAGHNLFDVAFAWLLAGRRGVRSRVEFEMLLGMASPQAEAVQADVGGLLLYTPVVDKREFDVAIAYLVRRLEEGASEDNFMSAVFTLSDDENAFRREEERFRASLVDLHRSVPSTNRTQDRNLERYALQTYGFENVPDTDPSTAPNRTWARSALDRAPSSDLGAAIAKRAAVHTAGDLEALLDTAARGAVGWGSLSAGERAAVLRRAAATIEERRGELIEVMAAECGKTVDQADPEISETVDFANYYAAQAEALTAVDGAAMSPVSVTVVTPPWNFPVAIPAGSTLAALASGSAVVLKPARQAMRCGAVLARALWDAGVPADVLTLVNLPERELGAALVSDARVDRVILTGAYETAELFRSFRPNLSLLAETSGKNAIVVTASADLDLAVRDVVQSAFGHAGQKCSATSLVILVGSVAGSRRFTSQLRDAVESLVVGEAWDAETQMGPLIGPADGKLLTALTTLDAGEKWLVEPKRLGRDGRLWTPGVKTGVAPGSPFHLTEYFGPVLGVMSAPTLSAAIELQNAVDYGLTAGLHSLDPGEIRTWLDSVEAGNLYVNRGTTGAIVNRQPFGGWKKSAVGPGAKAGGPNYLLGLVNWRSAQSESTHEPRASSQLLIDAAAQCGEPADVLAFLIRSARSDAQAWDTEFSRTVDLAGLVCERNLLRYRPAEVDIRQNEDDPLAALIRVVSAGVVAGARIRVSAHDLAPGIERAFSRLGVTAVVESDRQWLASPALARSSRLRLLGPSTDAVVTGTRGRPDLAIYAQPVTESGRLEILPFLREQSVSITAHRFGTPNSLTAG